VLLERPPDPKVRQFLTRGASNGRKSHG
jgi:hypothetical protein